MHSNSSSAARPRPWSRRGPHRSSAIAALAIAALAPPAMDARAQAASPDAAALHARFDAQKDKFAHNPFGRPVVIESTQAQDWLEGKVLARVDQPWPVVQKALRGTDSWCGMMILHLNVKMCHARPDGLDVALGRKYDQPVSDAYMLHLGYKLEASAPDYLKAGLASADGPLGTRDYRFEVEAAPLDATHTILSMSYAYGFGAGARIAMNAYLSTAGSDKVGFTAAGADADGKPAFVRGVRGLVERNTMRYYLAIDAFVAAPAPAQLDERLNAWFDATERYSRQLHEIDKPDYLAMKKVEAKR
ncbi:MAG: hypothetical protein ABW032_12595 [Burkholderiaceae bacterium]